MKRAQKQKLQVYGEDPNEGAKKQKSHPASELRINEAMTHHPVTVEAVTVA